MSRLYEICGGYIHKCNCCEKEQSPGLSILYWKKEDFSLCVDCLERLFFEHLYEKYHKDEDIKTKRKTINEKMRDRVLKKYKHKCKECGSTKNLEIDHIIPFSIGGTTDKKNLQVLCKVCNLKKRNKYNG